MIGFWWWQGPYMTIDIGRRRWNEENSHWQWGSLGNREPRFSCVGTNTTQKDNRNCKWEKSLESYAKVFRGWESFPKSQLFAWGGQSTGVSALASFLPMNTQDWSPLEWTGWISLQSKGLSRLVSNTTVQKHQFFGAQPSSQSNYHTYTWPQELWVSKILAVFSWPLTCQRESDRQGYLKWSKRKWRGLIMVSL